jgi:sulfur-oxidizing protein SoxX
MTVFKVSAGRRGRPLGLLAAGLLLALSPPVWAQTGDAARGAAIVASRSQGLCGLCHALPGQPDHLQGTLGPPLHGVGARYSTADLRAHLLAPERFNPDTLMPAYGRSDGLVQVAQALRGKPLLAPQQIDDVVAYLASLR